MGYGSFLLESNTKKTRLSLIESQPKKVAVVDVVVVVVVVAIVVGHKNLTLKFGQNWVNDKLGCAGVKLHVWLGFLKV